MNISKHEQRVLHVLAQGGVIHFDRLTNGKIHRVRCVTREGHALTDCSFRVFTRLKRRHFIKSVQGRPYRITRPGLRAVNSQQDNRYR